MTGRWPFVVSLSNHICKRLLDPSLFEPPQLLLLPRGLVSRLVLVKELLPERLEPVFQHRLPNPFHQPQHKPQVMHRGQTQTQQLLGTKQVPQIRS